MNIPELRELLKGTILEDCRLDMSGNDIFLGYDFPENEDGDSWDEYLMVQETLRSLGYELHNAFSEHDFVGGVLRKL